MKERILEYLAAGIPGGQVATIVGCTPAYVSQLLKDDDFKAELRARLQDVPENAEEVSLDAKYTSLEHSIIAQMQSSMATAEMPALTQALRVVSERQEKRRIQKNPALAPPLAQVNVVQLTLPAAFQQQPQKIVMNENKEVLSIGNNVLAPLSVDGVKSLFSKLRGENVPAPLPDPQTIEASSKVL